MPDIVSVEYQQTGNSKSTNPYGMREMQERAFEYRDAQYMLLKSPPASGKSRALMFLGLDKLINQGIKKVVVAVPERSIGSSFAPTDLKKFGFFAIGLLKKSTIYVRLEVMVAKVKCLPSITLWIMMSRY